MQLIIVESPTKAKTISRFLGPNYRVFSSYGHIRDLPEKEFGVDIKNNFRPKYVILPKARKIIKFLENACRKAKITIIATDEDREGEAIAWHLIDVLNLNESYQRIVFHEITKEAIKAALRHPRDIDMNLVNAQQTRRILDRIVGYKLSPFLWKKVFRGLSAGRVQSVAVRLIVEREKEIKKFVPQEYWQIKATFKKLKNSPDGENFNEEFQALLFKKNKKLIPQLGIKSKKEAEKIVKDLEGAEYKVKKVEKKEKKRNPLPPFVTSSLQQEAWKRFHWPAKFTMQIAQNLYERGFITYHRTDSLNLSKTSLLGAKKFIIENYGKNYWAGFFRKYQTKTKGAQEAHEAIRPTYSYQTPEALKIQKKLDENQFRLYELIWRRFIASQMAQAHFDSTYVEILGKILASQRKNAPYEYSFKAKGQILKFDGFLKIYPIKYKEEELPFLKEGEILELLKLLPSQHFTQPPPRYTEATLIKALEEEGIGRPSTYAPILSTIQERNYVEKDEKKHLRPTEIGVIVNNLLVEHFPKIVDIKFTARMEKQLDEIAQGKKKWTKVLEKFYGPFTKNLQEKYRTLEKKDIVPQEKTEKSCPQCGSPLLIRLGKFGKFYACSKFPQCTYTEPLREKELEVKCPKCEKGKIIEKKTNKGKIFYGCNQFPQCDFALWDKPKSEACPKCGFPLTEKKKKIRCSNQKCDFEKSKF